MKKSKQANTPELEDEVDKISNMPDHVLQLILSNIPSTEEVIRTSILSSRWRYLWTSVPFIDIDYTRGLNPLTQFDSNGFREFVYWVLLNKPLELDSFHLRCEYYYSMSTLSRWIHAAVMRKVKLLDLTFCPKEESEDVQIPHSLVTCDSLEVFKLCLLGSRLSVPNITGFQALRVLVLNDVEFVNDSVRYFFRNCPLLDDLSLFDCCTHNLYDLDISCPNLKRLTIIYRAGVSYEEFCKDKGMCDNLEISCPNLVFLMLIGYVGSVFYFESLYSLKKVVIHPEGLCEDEESPLVDGFSVFSHVEVLSISLYCVAMCYYPPEAAPISLPNLKTLELSIDGFAMNDLIPFLVCFPHLESLRLIITQVNHLEDWKLDDVATMRTLTCCLKLVEFFEFDGDERKVVVARFLLEHGNALEEMAFLWDKEAEYHEKSIKAMTEISKFHKASSTVKLRCGTESTHL